MPRISVIVPVYNSSEYLRPCVESVLTQSNADFELILIDDGSTDRSAEICDQYASADSRVRCMHVKNSGVSAARNLGLSLATGEYVTFVDSDDMLLPGALAIISDYVNNKSIDIIQFGLTRNLGNKVSTTPVMTPDKYVKNGYLQVCAGGSVIKNLLIKDHNVYFDETLSLAEDQIFIMRVVNLSTTVMRLSEVLYFYRDNITSATHRPVPDKIWTSAEKLLCFKTEFPQFAKIVDRTLLSFIYLLVILVDKSELYRVKSLYKQSDISSAHGSNKGVRLFYFISKIDFMLSSNVIRLLK